MPSQLTCKPFRNQVYKTLKAECLKAGKLFEDDEFPANHYSISRKSVIREHIVWKRPFQIVNDPKFIINGVTSNDIDQGQLSNCWLISAVAALSIVPEFVDTVIPPDQSFDSPEYAGIFHFRFWQYGEWYDVVVDDRLPVSEKTNTLLFCRNDVSKNEMFGALFEKAYAKLYLCYEFLRGGKITTALIDMTGGVHESFTVSERKLENLPNGVESVNKEEFWKIIFKSLVMKSFCGASISVPEDKSPEYVEQNGLVLGHSYCVLSVFEIISNNGRYDQLRESIYEEVYNDSIRLLKMRNPWGHESSWNGNWSAKSKQWNKIDPILRKSLNAENQNGGLFFISLEDFVDLFDNIDFVHVNMNAFYDPNSYGFTQYKWQCKDYHGEWKPGINSGGCGVDSPESYWLNPQFKVNLKSLPTKNKERVSLIVSLMQTEQVRKRYESDGSHNESFEAIGFSVFKVRPSLRHSKSITQYGRNSDKWETTIHGIRERFNPKLLEPKFICYKYSYQREFIRRFDLEPGTYVIIPSTYVKDTQMKFFLRLFHQTEVLKNENLVQIMHSAQILNEINYIHRSRAQQIQLVQKRDYPYAVKSSNKNAGMVVSGRQLSRADTFLGSTDDNPISVINDNKAENFRFNYLRSNTGASKLNRSLSSNYVARDHMNKINQSRDIDSLFEINNQIFNNRYYDTKTQSKACLIM